MFLVMLTFGLSKRLYLFLDFIPINIDFILHSIELAIPSSSNIFLLNNTLKSIFPNFSIIFLIFITSYCPSHTSFEILNLIRHKIETISLFSFSIKLKDSILKSTCPKRNNRCTTTEKLMLNDSSRLK